MIIGLVLLAATVVPPPTPISQTVTDLGDGTSLTRTTYNREDVQRYDAQTLDTDYKTYLKARKQLQAHPTWTDHQGYTWSKSTSGNTLCRLKGLYGSCVTH